MFGMQGPKKNNYYFYVKIRSTDKYWSEDADLLHEYFLYLLTKTYNKAILKSVIML